MFCAAFLSKKTNLLDFNIKIGTQASLSWFDQSLVISCLSADEQVCLYKEFTLKATINHSVTMQAGHSWAHIKDEDNSGWLKYNGTSVIGTPCSGLSSTFSYVFFYVAT